MKRSSSARARRYGQYCGVARALDLIGDRWNLLIVRQLLVGPARYGQLLDGLPGVATNLLADRLRDLETAGVINRQLADQGNAIVYSLTPWGAELREPIEGLIRWSTPLMVRGPDGDVFRAEWLMVALRALLARTTTRRSATVAVDGRDVDATIRADPSVILGLAAGELRVDQIAALATIEGDQNAIGTVFDQTSRSTTRSSPSPHRS